MILLAAPSKPFSLTSKNTPRRQIIIKDYEDEINALYDTVEQSTQAAPGVTVVGWDEIETRIFVRAVVTKVLVGRGNLGDEDDLFQLGCDRYASIARPVNQSRPWFQSASNMDSKYPPPSPKRDSRC